MALNFQQQAVKPAVGGEMIGRAAYRSGTKALGSIALILSLPTLAGATSNTTLTFPQIAAGPGIEMEINLVNTGDQIEPVEVRFWTDEGEKLKLPVSGAGSVDRLKFNMAGRSTRKIRIAGGVAVTGYATVSSALMVSNLTGNITITLFGTSDISIADSVAASQARVFVEETSQLGSGIAILNPGQETLEVTLTLLNRKGEEVASIKVNPEGRQKLTGFLPELFKPQEFPQLFRDAEGFQGTLRASADAPFHLLGLRQRTGGSLASLPVSTVPANWSGSQLLFLVDSGIDMRDRGFSAEELASGTVADLTGLTKAVKANWLKITNNHREQAVTLHFYYLNDQCRNALDFLLVLPCGETLTFDPFDLVVPTPVVDVSTENLLFGHDMPAALEDWAFPASHFGSGRFILSVVACGVSLDKNNSPELLYPNEIMIDEFTCGVTPVNTGSKPGYNNANLHIYNARPMVFDFLTGAHWALGSSCLGPLVAASEEMKAKSDFTRTLVPLPSAKDSDFVTLATPSSAELFEALEKQGENQCGDLSLPATVAITWGSEPLTILSND
jgi:hypothetical protein